MDSTVNKTLTPVNEAIALILAQDIKTKMEEIAVDEAYGRVLFEDVEAKVSLPPFDQSAMDGYGLKYSDLKDYSSFTLCGEIAAGAKPDVLVKPGEVVRIFTGAPLAEGIDTVIMQEDVQLSDGKISFDRSLVNKGQHVRVKGAQIHAGECAMKAGTRINAGAVGYLAALGITHVNVYRIPKVGILVTGDELVQRGQPLQPGQIYESNSPALKSALRSAGIMVANTISAKDDADDILHAMERLYNECDVVLITGGVSVGDYDFTGKALKELGVENIFYKIAQKPGKPIWFGRKENTLFFGLPGNPASVLSCFYEYVFPSLANLGGANADHALKKVMIPLSVPVNKKPGLTHFLKGKLRNGKVIPLPGQESFILSSFAEADCLIRIPAESAELGAGTLVECHLLPG